jgi:hypothetical protein
MWMTRLAKVGQLTKTPPRILSIVVVVIVGLAVTILRVTTTGVHSIVHLAVHSINSDYKTQYMKEKLNIITADLNKLDGDIEHDTYVILALFKKLGIEYDDDISPRKAFYLYLCSMIEMILSSDTTDDEFLNEADSEDVDRIEEIIEVLESYNYNQ